MRPARTVFLAHHVLQLAHVPGHSASGQDSTPRGRRIPAPDLFPPWRSASRKCADQQGNVLAAPSLRPASQDVAPTFQAVIQSLAELARPPSVSCKRRDGRGNDPNVDGQPCRRLPRVEIWCRCSTRSTFTSIASCMSPTHPAASADVSAVLGTVLSPERVSEPGTLPFRGARVPIRAGFFRHWPLQLRADERFVWPGDLRSVKIGARQISLVPVGRSPRVSIPRHRCRPPLGPPPLVFHQLELRVMIVRAPIPRPLAAYSCTPLSLFGTLSKQLLLVPPVLVRKPKAPPCGGVHAVRGGGEGWGAVPDTSGMTP